MSANPADRPPGGNGSDSASTESILPAFPFLLSTLADHYQYCALRESTDPRIQNISVNTQANLVSEILSKHRDLPVIDFEEDTLSINLGDSESWTGTARTGTARSTMTAHDIKVRNKSNCSFLLMFLSQAEIDSIPAADLDSAQSADSGPLGKHKGLLYYVESVRNCSGPKYACNKYAQENRNDPSWILKSNNYGTARQALSWATIYISNHAVFRFGLLYLLWRGEPISNLSTSVGEAIRKMLDYDADYATLWTRVRDSALVRSIVPEDPPHHTHGRWPEEKEMSEYDSFFIYMRNDSVANFTTLQNSFIAIMISMAKAAFLGTNPNIGRLSLQFGEMVHFRDISPTNDYEVRVDACHSFSRVGCQGVWHAYNAVGQDLAAIVTKLSAEIMDWIQKFYTSPLMEFLFRKMVSYWGRDTLYDINNTAQGLTCQVLAFPAAVADRVLASLAGDSDAAAALRGPMTLKNGLITACQIHAHVLDILIRQPRARLPSDRARSSSVHDFLDTIQRSLNVPNRTTLPALPKAAEMTTAQLVLHFERLKTFGSASDIPKNKLVSVLKDDDLASGTSGTSGTRGTRGTSGKSDATSEGQLIWFE